MDFIKCYDPENRFDRKPAWTQETQEGRWRAYTYEELVLRDKLSLEDSENLSDPDVIARDIAENLESALEQFSSIREDLGIK